MTHCILSPESATALFRNASLIRDALAAVQIVDVDQLHLDLGTDQALETAMDEREDLLQAIDNFMVEREELKALNAHLTGVNASQARALTTLLQAGTQPPTVSILGAENARLRADVGALEGAAIHAAAFIDSLRETLRQMGVTFEASAIGTADVTVDADELANWAYQTHQAQRAQQAIH